MLHASIPLLSHYLRRLMLMLTLGVLGGGAEPAALRETTQPKNEPEALEAIWEGSFSVKHSRVKELQRRQVQGAPNHAEALSLGPDGRPFAVREKAMQQLEKLGDRAATELRKVLAGKPSLEVKRRIEQLLEKQNGADHVRMVRALETLETIGTAEARALCAALAEGVADAPLTREARATLRRMTR